MAVGDLQKKNDITDKKDSVHKKKSIGGDKSRQKSPATGRKAKKIGM